MKYDKLEYLPSTDDVYDEIIRRIGPRPDGECHSPHIVAYWDKQYAALEEELVGAEEIYFDCRSSLSCAFGASVGGFSNKEEACWKQFCYLATQTAKEGRPTLIPITSKEHLMLDLLDACPFVRPVAATKSRHGDYTVFIYVMEVPQ